MADDAGRIIVYISVRRRVLGLAAVAHYLGRERLTHWLIRHAVVVSSGV